MSAQSPYFSTEAQTVFCPGDRVYMRADDTVSGIAKGTEGVYVCHRRELAIVDFDTPSGFPYRVAMPMNRLKQLYV